MGGGSHCPRVVVTLRRPDGGRGTLKVKPETTVGQLKAKVVGSSPLVPAGARLALLGVELDDDSATVASLALVQGDTFDVLPPLDNAVGAASLQGTQAPEATTEAAPAAVPEAAPEVAPEAGSLPEGDGEVEGDDVLAQLPAPLGDLLRRFDRVNAAATFLQMQRAPTPTVDVLRATCTDVPLDLASLALMARLCPRALCLAPSQLRDDRDDCDRGSPRPTGTWRVHVLDPGKGGRPEEDHRLPERKARPRAGMEAVGGAALRRTRCFRERCLEAAAQGRAGGERGERGDEALTVEQWVALVSGTGDEGGAQAPAELGQRQRPKAKPKEARKAPRATEEAALGPTAACSSGEGFDAEEWLAHVKTAGTGIACRGQIVHEARIHPRQARCRAPGAELDPRVEGALRTAGGVPGIHAMYVHQSDCIDAVVGRKVPLAVVSTPTASGKSLCYVVPLLQMMCESPRATAILVFPTKALAQDQLISLRKYVVALGLPGVDASHAVACYDGDTPALEREAAKNAAKILVTNPDMLHRGVLPAHEGFRRILENLRLVVVDEAHVYRGAFGCHAALVFRRLIRVCAKLHRNDLVQFVCGSATVSNAGEHVGRLLGLAGAPDPEVFSDDGSPCGARAVLLWNPPLKPEVKRKSKHAKLAAGGDRGRGRRDSVGVKRRQAPRVEEVDGGAEGDGAGEDAERRERPPRYSALYECAHVFVELVRHGLRTIAFCKTRKCCELVLRYSRDILEASGRAELAEAVRSYRGGYTPEERRSTERDLSEGSLLGVCATNALELGVDVGGLDATVHLGWQGSCSSFWQQAGRAGRRGRTCISVYVAFNGPLDHYILGKPGALLQGSGVERCHVDPGNPVILQQHLACAAAELPPLVLSGELLHFPESGDTIVQKSLAPGDDAAFFGAGSGLAARRLMELKKLTRLPADRVAGLDQLAYTGRVSDVWSTVSLRAVDDDRYSVVDSDTGRELESVESCKVNFQCYEGGIYINHGQRGHRSGQYLCSKVDHARRLVLTRKTNVGYFTSVIDHKDISPEGGSRAYPCEAVADAAATEAASRVDDGLPTNLLIRRPVNSELARVLAPRFGKAQYQVRYTGFSKFWIGTGQIFDRVMLEGIPSTQYQTVAAWVAVPRHIRHVVEASGREWRASLHTAQHALINRLGFHVACDPGDVSTECGLIEGGDGKYRPERLLVYDVLPGGTGISQAACELLHQLVHEAADLLRDCDCGKDLPVGCPGCAQWTGCGAYNEVLDRQGGAVLLHELSACCNAFQVRGPPQACPARADM